LFEVPLITSTVNYPPLLKHFWMLLLTKKVEVLKSWNFRWILFSMWICTPTYFDLMWGRFKFCRTVHSILQYQTDRHVIVLYIILKGILKGCSPFYLCHSFLWRRKEMLEKKKVWLVHHNHFKFKSSCLIIILSKNHLNFTFILQ